MGSYTGQTALISIGGTFLDPTSARTIPHHRIAKTATITNIRGFRTNGTGATINVQKNGTDILESDLSITSVDTWTTSSASMGVVAGDELNFVLASVSGEPTEVVIQVDMEL